MRIIIHLRPRRDRYLLVASKGGADHHPLGYRDLKADPAVTLQVGADIIRGGALKATPAEKAALWPVMTAVFPRYDEQQAKTRSDIPLAIVEPELGGPDPRRGPDRASSAP